MGRERSDEIEGEKEEMMKTMKSVMKDKKEGVLLSFNITIALVITQPSLRKHSCNT